MHPDDRFHVVGFTRDQVRYGALFRVMALSDHVLRRMAELHQQLGALQDAVAQGQVVRELVEIYFVIPFERDAAQELLGRLNQDYFAVYLLNDSALRVCQQYGIPLPPVAAEITRAGIPAPIGTVMQFPSFELA